MLASQNIKAFVALIFLLNSQIVSVYSEDALFDKYLAPATLEITQVYTNGRFPNIVVTTRGTLLATWGDKSVRGRRSTDGGVTWEKEIVIANSGIHGGGTTVDTNSGAIFVFVEAQHPPAPISVYRSLDDGLTWEAVATKIQPDSSNKQPSMHMNEHGITLKGDKFAGRLLRPSRHYGEGNRPESLWPTHFTNAIYSNDGGESWQTSEPFPENGTGEATLVELSDGRIYYNTRRHWAPEGKNPRRRWHGWSVDGGVTWQDVALCEVLPDGPQNTNYGCMAGLTRLPITGRDILIYSNCDDPSARRNGTVWTSFDGGKTWPLKRLVDSGAFAYSSLTAGTPNTPTEGWIFLHYESNGSKVARFNLRWLLEGPPTGDGLVPAWVQNLPH